jgi:hypothetical protein
MSKNGKQAAKPAQAQVSESLAERMGELAGVKTAFKPDGKGGGTLQLRYSGELARYPTVWVRLGERRHGADWLETRDVKLETAQGQATARVSFAPGEPLEGATFAFFATKGAAADAVWDNAGRPYGCYRLDAQSGAVEAR